jgi:serine/threonine protein kinase
LGATFYHLVTGFPPFQGDSAAEVMSKHMNEPLMNPQRRVLSLSDGLCDLITHMMEKDPSMRFQTMDELISALDRLDGGHSVLHQKLKVRKEGDPDSRVIAQRKNLIKNLQRVGAGLAIVLLFLLAVPFFTGKSSNKSNPQITVKTQAPKKINPTAQDSRPVTSPSDNISSTPSPVTVVETPPTQPMVVVPPKPVTPKQIPAPIISTSKPPIEEEETTTIQIGANDKSPTANGAAMMSKKFFYNWVDLLALLMMFLGIPMARYLGTLWGSIRAIAFWIAIYLSQKERRR